MITASVMKGLKVFAAFFPFVENLTSKNNQFHQNNNLESRNFSEFIEFAACHPVTLQKLHPDADILLGFFRTAFSLYNYRRPLLPKHN